MESETVMQHVSHRTSDEISELRAAIERLTRERDEAVAHAQQCNAVVEQAEDDRDAAEVERDALLAEVERLTRERDGALDANGGILTAYKCVMAERDALRAEVERLTIRFADVAKNYAELFDKYRSAKSEIERLTREFAEEREWQTTYKSYLAQAEADVNQLIVERDALRAQIQEWKADASAES